MNEQFLLANKYNSDTDSCKQILVSVRDSGHILMGIVTTKQIHLIYVFIHTLAVDDSLRNTPIVF